MRICISLRSTTNQWSVPTLESDFFCFYHVYDVMLIWVLLVNNGRTSVELDRTISEPHYSLVVDEIYVQPAGSMHIKFLTLFQSYSLVTASDTVLKTDIGFYL